MKPVDHPARAIAKNTCPPLGPSDDIVMEYWDLLFDAVVERLRKTSEKSGPCTISRRGLTLAQSRDSIVEECAQALDQLHRTASHEFARCRQTDDVGGPLTLGPPRILNAKNVGRIDAHQLAHLAGLAGLAGLARHQSRAS